MNKFKQIYDEEIEKQEGEPFFYAMLNHTETRAFVYEVCKRLLHGEGAKEVEHE